MARQQEKFCFMAEINISPLMNVEPGLPQAAGSITGSIVPFASQDWFNTPVRILSKA
jgi:hypothetical protein